MRISFLTLSTAGAAAAIAALAIPTAISAEDEVPRWQQARAIGEPESCISLARIRSTQVHDDRTIDFRMSGQRTYRNTLPNRCAGLGREEAFSYETSLSRLCSSDIITVIQSGTARVNGPSCGLGQFQEIEFPEEE